VLYEYHVFKVSSGFTFHGAGGFVFMARADLHPPLHSPKIDFHGLRQNSLTIVYIVVYTISEVNAMETAKIFQNGNSQAVRLPKNCRFLGDEVGVKKVGNTVLLFPLGSAWVDFLNSPPASDDFGESIAIARHEDIQSPREAL
jgi:antitoxin VapB